MLHSRLTPVVRKQKGLNLSQFCHVLSASASNSLICVLKGGVASGIKLTKKSLHDPKALVSLEALPLSNAAIQIYCTIVVKKLCFTPHMKSKRRFTHRKRGLNDYSCERSHQDLPYSAD